MKEVLLFMDILLTILNWSINLFFWIYLPWKMRKGVGLDTSTFGATDPVEIRKNERTHFMMGFLILTPVFILIGLIVQRTINNH